MPVIAPLLLNGRSYDIRLFDLHSNTPTGDIGFPHSLFAGVEQLLLMDTFYLWCRAPQKPLKMKEVIADPNVHLNDVYWINPNGEKCREFPIGETIKLYPGSW